jgi:hypothetical protein
MTADQDVTTAGGSTTSGPLLCGLEEADASLAAWEALGVADSASYYYIGQRFLMSTLPFTGPDCEYQTLIVVEDGAVTRRQMYDGLQSNDAVCAPGWIEEGEELGTHAPGEDGLPAPVWTLDEIYSSCCDLLANVSPEFEGFFFADDQGLLERCFIQASPCGDCTGVAPPEWGDEIRIVEFGIGPPPR